MDERKAFEAWWNAQHTMYAQNVTEWSWQVWQAATAAERERAAKVCDELHAATANNPERRNAMFDAAAAIRKG